jgi:hypothetical protein
VISRKRFSIRHLKRDQGLISGRRRCGQSPGPSPLPS